MAVATNLAQAFDLQFRTVLTKLKLFNVVEKVEPFYSNF